MVTSGTAKLDRLVKKNYFLDQSQIITLNTNTAHVDLLSSIIPKKGLKQNKSLIERVRPVGSRNKHKTREHRSLMIHCLSTRQLDAEADITSGLKVSYPFLLLFSSSLGLVSDVCNWHLEKKKSIFNKFIFVQLIF